MTNDELKRQVLENDLISARLEVYRAVFLIMLESQSFEDAKKRVIELYDREYRKKETFNAEKPAN